MTVLVSEVCWPLIVVDVPGVKCKGNRLDSCSRFVFGVHSGFRWARVSTLQALASVFGPYGKVLS